MNWTRISFAIAFFAIALVVVGRSSGGRTLACSVLGLGCPPWRYSGFVEKGWERVLEAAKEIFEAGEEVGSSLVIFHRGNAVVRVEMGYSDHSYTAPYGLQTVQQVFSASKVIESFVILMHVDRGLLDLDAPIAKYWPEFGANGKDSITIMHLLSHGGGVAYLNHSLTVEQVNDIEYLNKQLIAAVPDPRTWRARNGQGYHAFSRGLIFNEVIRRVDPKGRDIGQFAIEEIQVPLGEGSSLQLGMWPNSPLWSVRGEMLGWNLIKTVTSVLPRMLMPLWLSRAIYPHAFPAEWELRAMQDAMNPDSISGRALIHFFKGVPDLAPDWHDSPAQRMHDPSCNFFTNSELLARLANIIAYKGKDPISGIQFYSEKTWARATHAFPALLDAVLHINVSFTEAGWTDMTTIEGMPSWVKISKSTENFSGRCLGWGGWGGSLSHGCPDDELAIGYVGNLYAVSIADWRALVYLREALAISSKL